jgi:hypothetical protein
MKPMKLCYDRAGDILILQLGDLAESLGAVEAAPGVYLDVTDEGKVLALEILYASRKYPAEQLAALAVRYTQPIHLTEAALIAKTTSDALYRAIKRGRLQGQLIGRDWFVLEADLEAYMASRLHAGPGSRKAVAEARPGKARRLPP